MKQISKTLNGQVSCWGRNGHFKLDSIEVFHSTMSQEVYVYLRSKRIGRQAPIQFHGSHRDMMKVAEHIAGRVRIPDNIQNTWEEAKQILERPNIPFIYDKSGDPISKLYKKLKPFLRVISGYQDREYGVLPRSGGLKKDYMRGNPEDDEFSYRFIMDDDYNILVFLFEPGSTELRPPTFEEFTKYYEKYSLQAPKHFGKGAEKYLADKATAMRG